MPTLSIEINQEQAKVLGEIIDRNPGWNKALVVRALLAYFFQLDQNEQVNLVKKHRVKR